MKNKIAFGLIISTFLSFSCLMNVKAETKPKLSGWDLVDSGKHLDWTGSTKYQNAFNRAVNKWNAYKPGVIREDGLFTEVDVRISDFVSSSPIAGSTSNTGTIKFNTLIMDNLSVDSRRNACMHELGHALGLGDRTKVKKAVMYFANSEIINLREPDKISYDAAYNNY